MKKILSIILFILPLLAQSQTIDTLTPEGKTRYWNRQIGNNRILTMPDRTLSRTVNALRNLAVTRTPYLTMKDVRSGKADSAKVIHITDTGREGVFVYNPANTTAPDDSALVVRHANKRFERQYTGAVDARWFGIIGDGTTEMTGKIQRMVDNPLVKTMYFPKTAQPYRLDFISVPSNKHFVFEDGTEFLGLGLLGKRGGDSFRIRMWRIFEADGVSFRGKASFRDIKSAYAGPTWGEQRHIFLIQGSKNVTIEGITAGSSGGDGFYIGASSARPYSENIIIRDCIADDNKRQGMSIISAVNLLVDNCTFKNTAGIAPGAGIDMEPDAITDRYQNVRIVNCRVENNEGDGILILFSNNTNSAFPVDVVIDNVVSVGNSASIQFANCRGKLGGEVVVNNFQAILPRSNGARVLNWSANGPRVTFNNLSVSSPNATGSHAGSDYGAGVLLIREANSASDSIMGNIHFFNPKIEDTRDVPLIRGGFTIQSTSIPWVNCSFINPVGFIGVPKTALARIYGGGVFVRDDHGVLTQQVTGSLPSGLNLDILNYRRTYHNAGLGYETQVVASNFGRYWKADVTLEVRAAQYLRFKPNAANTITPLTTVGGKYIRSNVVGSKITLNWDPNTNGWTVKNIVGSWETEP